MLNNKIEKCPVCGKIKSKLKPCSYCGFDNSPTEAESDGMIGVYETPYTYFVSYAHSKGHGGIFVHSNHPRVSEELIRGIEKQIIEHDKDNNVCVLNVIKLED